MKLSDLKPCAACGGPLLGHPGSHTGNWYKLTLSMALLNPAATNRVLGLVHVLGGAFPLAEAMSPDAQDSVLIAGEQDPALLTVAHVCLECAVTHPLLVLEAMIRSRAEKAAA